MKTTRTIDNNHEHELRLDGVGGFVTNVKEKGQLISVTGWYRGHYQWNTGDRILLTVEKEGNRQTRYKILKVDRPGDPADMYFLRLKFLPRTAPGHKV